MKRRFLFVPLLLILLVLLQACISVTSTLQLVIAAAEAAVGVIDPPAAVLINPYLRAVSLATSFAATELASSDTSPVKAEKIIAQFASITAPNLPPGISRTIVAAVEAVTTAVTNFLATIQPAAPPPLTARTTGKAAPQTVPKQIKISSGDLTTLTSIKSRADALAAKIH